MAGQRTSATKKRPAPTSTAQQSNMRPRQAGSSSGSAGRSASPPTRAHPQIPATEDNCRKRQAVADVSDLPSSRHKRVRVAKSFGDDFITDMDCAFEETFPNSIEKEVAGILLLLSTSRPLPPTLEVESELAREYESQQKSPSSNTTSSHDSQPPSTPKESPKDDDAAVVIAVAKKRAPVRRKNQDGKICKNCEATDTPTWRSAGRKRPVCNKCGVYYITHKRQRPCPKVPAVQAASA